MMSELIDITSRTFGKLTVIKRDKAPRANKAVRWECICSCGNYKSINSQKLRNGKIKSCGCKRTRFNTDIAGRRFGRLVAISSYGKNSDDSTIWRCICDCSREIFTDFRTLITEGRRSCGCISSYSGRQIGSIYVVARIGINVADSNRRLLYQCVCECGKDIVLNSNHLRRLFNKRHNRKTRASCGQCCCNSTCPFVKRRSIGSLCIRCQKGISCSLGRKRRDKARAAISMFSINALLASKMFEIDRPI